ncbi:ankyrin repeat-containing domain protein [Aspergillus filifer]
MTRERRKWTPEEDILLRRAVQAGHGINYTAITESRPLLWREIAKSDETLRRSVERHGTNWSTIASFYFPKRTSLAVRNRYNAIGDRQKEGRREKRSGDNRVEKKTRCTSRASPIFSHLRNGFKDDSEDDNYNEHEDDDDEDEEEDDEDEESKEELSRNSSVDRHRKAVARRSISNGSWMNPDSGTTSPLPFVETTPSFTLSQPAPYSAIPYTMPELDLYDPSCWDSMLGVTGPDAAPGLSQELENSTVNDNKANVNHHGGEHGSALQAALYAGWTDIVQLLLDNGVNVCAQGYYDSALVLAAIVGNEDIVRVLLANGVDVNAQDETYRTALQAAAYEGQGKIVKALLDRNADIDACGGYYGTALQAACA